MAEDDIAFLLNRGELVEPHDNEQAEVNTILDKSSLLILSQCSWKCFLCFPEIKQNSYWTSANIKIFFLVQYSNYIWKNHILTVLITLLKKKYLLLYNKRVIAWILVNIVPRSDHIALARSRNMIYCSGQYLDLLINLDLLALILSNLSIQYKNFHWANTTKTS
jgi:hypothetical protein